MRSILKFVLIAQLLVASIVLAEELVITNARLIDGTGAAPIEGVSIVVSNGYIVSVTQDKVKVANSRVIDARGQTVLPGLADLHVHSSIQFLEDPEFIPLDPRATHPDPESGITSDKEMRIFMKKDFPRRMMTFIDSGITTIVDAGSFFPWIIPMRDKVRSGAVIGPHIYVAGRTFTAPAGHPAATVCEGNPWCVKNLTVGTDDPEIARKAVRNMVEAGVDGLKLAYDSILGEFSPTPIPQLKKEVMEAVIDEGHKLGVKVIAHTFTVADASAAANAGIDGLAHGVFVEKDPTKTPDGDSLGRLLNRFDIPVTTTVSFVPTADEINNLPAEELSSYVRAIFAPYGTTLRKMADAGVVLQFGTDFDGIGTDPQPRDFILREARNLIAGGFSQMEVIKMLTGNAAKHPFTPQNMGVIKAGNVADILILKGDPLVNIEAVAYPQVVLLAGKIVVDKRK